MTGDLPWQDALAKLRAVHVLINRSPVSEMMDASPVVAAPSPGPRSWPGLGVSGSSARFPCHGFSNFPIFQRHRGAYQPVLQ
jgi:hypothetical protein